MDITEAPKTEARRTRIKRAYKDINARGKGTKTYRMAVHGDSLVWIDQHPDVISDGNRLSSDDFRAAGRKDVVWCEAPEGLIVVEIEKSTSGSTSYNAGILMWSEEKQKLVLDWNDRVKHVGVKRAGGGFEHVLEINGERKSFRSA